MRDTLPLLLKSDFPLVWRKKLETIQINLGYRCNQACLHCHVAASPQRTEEMDWATMTAVLELARRKHVRSLDLTGGAPEMNPHFRRLVKAARKAGLHVIDRCNLTILGEPGYEGLAEFLAENKVEITASLPCYQEENVNKQRGDGVFEASINGLKKLNSLGYGVPDSGLTLNLVYNPQGAVLPPEQSALELSYKKHLLANYAIVFNKLFALANMPIKRFGSQLVSRNEFQPYMSLLRNAYRPDNLEDVMCRSLISVSWEGFVFDCDFNQMLGLPLSERSSTQRHISTLLDTDLEGTSVRVAGHCYGCTAGQGSSCGGALEEKIPAGQAA